MTFEDLLDQYGIKPPTDAVPLIRTLLNTHIDKERHEQGTGDTELMKVCCVQLFANGDISDSLLIWRAKTSSMDADASIDVHLLCGGGLLETKEYLASHANQVSNETLERILACERTGDFEGFSVSETLAFYEDYYSED